MYDLRATVLSHLHGALRFRWAGLLCWWLLALAGWSVVYTLPDQYRAGARVYVDTDSALRPLLRGLAVETDVMSQVNLMTRALLSRPQLEKVIRQTDLYLRAGSDSETEQLISRTRSNISISSGRGTNLYTISFIDHDRGIAQTVVKTLLDLFVEDTLGVNRQDSSNAQRFLDVQIGDYEKRLALAERELADFKKKHIGMLPGQEGDHYSRLETANGELDEVKGALAIALRKQQELQRQVRGEEPTFGITTTLQTTAVASPLDQTIAEYENRLADLLLNYTENHPDAVALRETIAQLKERREQAVRPEPQAANQPVQANPVYQSIRISLNQADLEVATLQERLQRKQAEVRKLAQTTNELPEIEAEMKRLNRDYEITKTQYEALLQRREIAKLSEEVEQGTDEVKFRIIEPPKAELKPIGPNRPLLLTAAMAGGLGFGAALCFFLHQLRPVYTTVHSLRESAQYPVLGSISAVRSPRQLRKRQRDILWFGLAVSILFMSYGLVIHYRESAHTVTKLIASGIPL